MTQPQRGTSVLPDRDQHVVDPVAPPTTTPDVALEAAKAVAAPPRGRRWIWLAIIVVGLIALGIAAALTDSNSDSADVSAQAQDDAGADVLSARILHQRTQAAGTPADDADVLNARILHQRTQAAGTPADEAAIDASDRHLLNQAARFEAAAAALGSDRHLENQAAKPVPDAE